MIKRLDRVNLTARASAVFNNNKRPSVVVLWDGRKSMDVVPIRSVELEPELGLPQTEHRL